MTNTFEAHSIIFLLPALPPWIFWQQLLQFRRCVVVGSEAKSCFSSLRHNNNDLSFLCLFSRSRSAMYPLVALLRKRRRNREMIRKVNQSKTRPTRTHIPRKSMGNLFYVWAKSRCLARATLFSPLLCFPSSFAAQ